MSQKDDFSLTFVNKNERPRYIRKSFSAPPEWTHIVIEEIDTDDWGFGGVTTTEYRKRLAEAAKKAQ